MANNNKKDPFPSPMDVVYAEVGLNHARECTNPNCELSSCTYLKPLMAHVLRCSSSIDETPNESSLAADQQKQVLLNAKCSKCIEYWDIVKLHAKNCRVSDCPIEKCTTLRPSSMRKKLMSRIRISTSSSSAAGGSVASNTEGSKVGSLILDAGDGKLPNPGEKPASGTTRKLTSKSSFISVGSDHQVPILSADEAYKHTAAEDQVPTNMENPMYIDEEMGKIPSERKAWWMCAA